MNKLPSDLKENKGRNVYYALPLLLGILGICWQRRKGELGRNQCLITFWLFFMTGVAIVLYLNQTPLQARERDYSYAGSFYAFCIWIGLGTGAVVSVLRRLKVGERTSVAAGILLCLLVPIQMGCQTWDDHDRSGRYTCRDFGQNYLESAPNEGKSIIFCNGDNDTFPLWYMQEVEGKRTDARVCNLSYASADWYIDQMLRPAYDSPAFTYCLKRTSSSLIPSVRLKTQCLRMFSISKGSSPSILLRVCGSRSYNASTLSCNSGSIRTASLLP